MTIGASDAPDSYKKRNDYMVDQVDYLLAVYDNDKSVRSGTRQTVNYAAKKKLPLTFIHPDTAVVFLGIE